MKSRLHNFILLLILASLLDVSAVHALQRLSTFQRSEDLIDQESLDVRLIIGGGRVWLTKAEYENLFSVEVDYNREEIRPRYEYIEEDDEAQLYFSIRSKDEEYDEFDFLDEDREITLGLSSLKKTSWDLKFTDKIPIDMNIAAGATKANLDFSGLMIRNLDIETGATRMFVTFDEPNPIRMEKFNLELGLAKFKGSHLLNANFDEMNVESGLGSCTLDLTGELDHRAYVDIEVGFSKLTLILPSNVGVKLYVDVSTFTTFDSDDLIPVDEDDEDEFVSENWGETEGELIIDLEASVGFVDIIMED